MTLLKTLHTFSTMVQSATLIKNKILYNSALEIYKLTYSDNKIKNFITIS